MSASFNRNFNKLDRKTAEQQMCWKADFFVQNLNQFKCIQSANWHAVDTSCCW